MRWLLAVTILLPLVIAACSSSDPADQERANVDVVRRLYTEVWSSGDVSVLDEIIGDGYVSRKERLWRNGQWSATGGCKDSLGRSILMNSLVQVGSEPVSVQGAEQGDG